MGCLYSILHNMSSITKNQTALALVVVAFAAVMIAGTIALSADPAFARKHHHSKVVVVHQSHDQAQTLTQHSQISTAGTNSPIDTAIGNVGVQAQTNDGGNNAQTDASDNN
jgi:hypothetical protein